MTIKSPTPGQAIKKLTAGQSKSVAKVPGGGRIEARCHAGGVLLYWRHTDNGRTSRELIGPYDPKAPPESVKPKDGAYGWSIRAAEQAALAMLIAHQAQLEQGSTYRESKLAQQAAQQAAKEAKAILQTHTLKAMLEAYCDRLAERPGRSHSDARSMFTNHVLDAFPKVAKLPACNVTSEQIVTMLDRLREAGKARTSNKLRSYIGAAYQTALKAKRGGAIPVKFKAFKITHNPVTDTARDETADRDDKNPLSTEQMRLYWSLIKDLDGIKGVALRLHLLTGAPRIEQLVNARVEKVRDGYIELTDTKGRGSKSRLHAVALVGRALQDVQSLPMSGEWLLSTDGGETHIAATTLSGWAKDVAGELIPDFLAKRLRSGVETLLASKRVSSDVRGHIQSHGISGIQAKHYNAYNYMDEKIEALELLHMSLEPVANNVLRGAFKQA
ncbi:MAG: integrase [Rhodoferax sp.]|nr:integrase [Rhodoferax sp.]MCF8211113.1 integrase [Rhodoferax sp.]